MFLGQATIWAGWAILCGRLPVATGLAVFVGIWFVASPYGVSVAFEVALPHPKTPSAAPATTMTERKVSGPDRAAARNQ